MKYLGIPASTVFFCLVLFISTQGISEYKASGAPPDVREIIRKVDQMYRSSSSYSEIEMEIQTPHWQRTLLLKAWTKGTDKTFIRILAPKKEQGVATLRIGAEMWQFLPKTNKIIKIPPSMMMSSWMGSDFTNDDLVREFSLVKDYDFEPLHLENLDTGLIAIKCIPHPNVPVVWSYLVIAVTRGDYIPVWDKYYHDRGEAMRVLTYSDISTFGGRRIPATMEMVPQNEAGHKTIIRYKRLIFDENYGDDIFSLRNLQTIE